MIDFLRIYVLWASLSSEGERVAEIVSQHFDGIGMERDGVAHRIPVRYRSQSWDLNGSEPRAINLEAAAHNVIVLLHDGDMYDARDYWSAYVSRLRAEMDRRHGRDVYVPFGSPDGHSALVCDRERHTHYAQRHLWRERLPKQESRDTRLLLHLVFKIREHLRRVFRDPDGGEPLFVSHAKADGDETARDIVRYVSDPNQDVPLRTFYDAKELSPGDDFNAEFLDTIKQGTLLAIVSDVYDSRPWCVFELTTAKRAGRPIVLADVGGVRTSRTFPYGANVPRVRISRNSELTEWVEPLLVETLSEGLRCDVFQAQAARVLHAAGNTVALVLPRPPELLDLVERAQVASTVIYPDPPLGRLEQDILRRAMVRLAPDVVIKSLSELE